MLKRLIFISASSVLIGVLLFGREVASYLTTSAGQLSETVRSQVPIDFELERAEQMISDLTPQIGKNMHVIAREEVELERLTDKIAALEARQSKGKESLTRLQHELDSGRDEIWIGNSQYSLAEAKRLAEARFDRYTTDELTLGLLRRACATRQGALELASRKLDGMLVAKQQLLAEVANLRARQMMNEVTRIDGDFRFDDSQLARTRELIEDLESRIQVDERMAELEADSIDDLLESEAAASDDIARRISNYFGDGLVVGSEAAVTLAESLP